MDLHDHNDHNNSENIELLTIEPNSDFSDNKFPTESYKNFKCFNLQQKINQLYQDYLIKWNSKEIYSYFCFIRGNPLWKEVKQNLRAGVTVSLVSVPLSISLAIAGSATPVMGVVSAFWAGLAASMIGGSHYNIVGPTGALSGTLASVSQTLGVDALSILSIMAGLLCILVWLLRLDKYVMFIPSSVIHGFTVGVAFIISLNQLNSAFGLTNIPPKETFLENVWESLKGMGHTDPYSFLFFFINFVALFLLLRKWPNIPWAIIISGIGILFGFLSTKNIIPLHLQTLYSKYGELKFQLVKFPKINKSILDLSLITSSFGVAFIAILETLISARIADSMTKTEHNQSREVLGVGVANLLSGIMGGIPATAALARTALNVKSGATSRVSAIINSFCVLILSFLVLPLFQFIPMPTVAALLTLVAVRMIDSHHLLYMWKYDKKMFWVAMLSAIVCIVIDTMAGIIVGGVVSLMIFIDQMSTGHSEAQLNKGHKVLSQVDLTKLDSHNKKLDKATYTELAEYIKEKGFPPADKVPEVEEFGDTLVYRIGGQLTYINAIAHINRCKIFSKDRSIKNIIISLRYLWYIDLDGVDSLKMMIDKLEKENTKVLLSGIINGNVSNMLEKHSWYQERVENKTVFPSYIEALQAIDSTGDDHHIQENIDDEILENNSVISIINTTTNNTI